MIQPALSKKIVLGRTGCTVSHRSDMVRYFQSGKTHASAGVMNQHRFSFSQPAHDNQQGPGRQIIHGNSGSLFEAEVFGLFKHLSRGDDDKLSLPAETRQRNYGYAG